MKRRKFLCVCQYGHSRSAALVRVLHGMGHDAVALGAGTASPELINLLSNWADHIALFLPASVSQFPMDDRDKILDFDIGRDRWSNPYHPELLEVVRERLNKVLPEAHKER